MLSLHRSTPLATPPSIESNSVARLRAALPPELGRHLRHLNVAVSLVKAERPAGPPPPLPLPTATPLDALLDGGLPRGELVEIHGRRSSGRFALALAAIAAATNAGETTALVDLGDHLETAAAVAAGADLERLLWVRPHKLAEALAAAEMLLQTGFALVVVDLGLPPVRGGRGAEGAWQRLARAAREANSALLVTTPYRATGTAATAVLSLAPARSIWSAGEERLLERFDGEITVEKRRGSAGGREAELVWRSPALPAPTLVRESWPAERVARSGGSVLRRAAAL